MAYWQAADTSCIRDANMGWKGTLQPVLSSKSSVSSTEIYVSNTQFFVSSMKTFISNTETHIQKML